MWFEKLLRSTKLGRIAQSPVSRELLSYLKDIRKKLLLTLPVVEIHLDPFENVCQDDVNKNVAATPHNGRYQSLKVKSVKNVLCVKFLFIDVFQSFSENLSQLVKVRLGVKLSLSGLTSGILVALVRV